MHKYLTEFIGTFFLVLTIGLMSVGPSPGTLASTLAPLAIGATLMVMVYMGGHVSGAHYNPAVSLAVMLRGRLGVFDFIIYVVAQVVGALVASATVYFIEGATFAPAPSGSGATLEALIAELPDSFSSGSLSVASKATVAALLVEFLYTFALALVVLSTATAKKAAGNSYFGLAIGFTVVVAAFVGGGISGGAFNPAVGVGPTVVDFMWGGGTFDHLWLYLAGPLAGGVVAALVFWIQERGANAS